MQNDKVVLFVCEKFYLRFYGPLASRLARSGFRPVWAAIDGFDRWDYEYLDPTAAVETLTATPGAENSSASLCVFERRFFEQPDLFERSYPYTMNVVRTMERAPAVADAWYRLTRAMLRRFEPSAVFVWNGRYLPYSAVAAACESSRQLLLTSEIGWIPGTMFLDRGALSATTTDLLGREFDSIATTDTASTDAFLRDYTGTKATMVSQPAASASDIRLQALGTKGSFLLLYGCQVDWDTNVVIGARRFHSNESAVSFLVDCLSDIPGGRMIVKTHPLDANQKPERLREILDGRGIVVADIHPHSLIQAADCVAVRNSTLGFEALCYRKPLLLLEDAKYRDPRLTLAADSREEGVANLRRVAAGKSSGPDPHTLHKFMLHLLDRYLTPVRYDYFFEPEKLQILSHLARNESLQALETVLSNAAPATVEADAFALRALDGCRIRGRTRPFLARFFRRAVDWRS